VRKNAFQCIVNDTTFHRQEESSITLTAHSTFKSKGLFTGPTDPYHSRAIPCSVSTGVKNAASESDRRKLVSALRFIENNSTESHLVATTSTVAGRQLHVATAADPVISGDLRLSSDSCPAAAGGCLICCG